MGCGAMSSGVGQRTSFFFDYPSASCRLGNDGRGLAWREAESRVVLACERPVNPL